MFSYIIAGWDCSLYETTIDKAKEEAWRKIDIYARYVHYISFWTSKTEDKKNE